MEQNNYVFWSTWVWRDLAPAMLSARRSINSLKLGSSCNKTHWNSKQDGPQGSKKTWIEALDKQLSHIACLQWRPKELGTVWKTLPSNFDIGLCSLRQFCDRLWVHPFVPTPLSNVVAKKKTHFHPWCSELNFVWGGRGGVTSFTN